MDTRIFFKGSEYVLEFGIGQHGECTNKRTRRYVLCLTVILFMSCEDASLELQQPFCAHEDTSLETNNDMLRVLEQKDGRKLALMAQRSCELAGPGVVLSLDKCM